MDYWCCKYLSPSFLMPNILISFLKLWSMQILDYFFYYYPDMVMILLIMAFFMLFQVLPFVGFAVAMFLFYSTVPIILKVLQGCWSLLMILTNSMYFQFFFLMLHLHLHSLVCCRYVAQPCWTSRSWLQTCGLFWSASSLIMRRFVHCPAFFCTFRILY